ncbi:SRPBCC family protein [Massilia aurea]|uniref:aromatic ring-hydroxylating oxygenase subunit alpha n=1 Tax=Massilia aurea TaxID=373040 RepID=UPI0034618B91
MRSRMPPQAYIDETWFARERALLFKPLWQFIGLKVMLEKHNAFIARTLFGIPVVVQNFHGELRAFENICPHRQNPIQVQPHGVRPLFCGYHGWSFDRDGATRIPHEEALYRFPQEERACIHLRSFALEVVGNLVFVCLAETPLPIKQQFGAAMLASLTASSLAYDSEVIMTTYEGHFNWKLAYENLRDGHHPRYLHARSLYQDVKFEASISEEGVTGLRRLQRDGIADRSRALGLMRSFSGGGRDAPMESPPNAPHHANLERYRDQDWYYNWLAFPNLHIASANGGYAFIVEHHVPVSAGRTDLVVYYLTAKKKQPYASSAAVLHAHMMGADVVMREDIEVMEQIQRTLHPDARSPHLGDYEFINASLELWYLDLMEGKFAL